jgi:ADP-ribosyl-[dinitrogen reductase] hydrolase
MEGMTVITRNKVRGALAGVVIGDALGMPVEGWTKEAIAKKFPGGIRKYEDPKETGHKWFNGLRAGATTDDTQLTASVLKAIMEADSFDMDAIAKYHALAMSEDNNGWGRTTKEAIRRLNNGVHWSESGKTTDEKMGTGNGVPMKVTPLAILYSCCSGSGKHGFNQKLVDFGAMTHYTRISALAGIVHTHILSGLLANTSPVNYSLDWDFIDLIRAIFWWQSDENKGDPTYYTVQHLNETPDSLELSLYRLRDMLKEGWDLEQVHSEFGNGTYYVLHSLCFTYAYFLRGHLSIQSLYDVVSAGGDTDSNGSMLGAMLGALHGIELFEQKEHRHLLDNEGVNMMLSLADTFCRKFGL